MSEPDFKFNYLTHYAYENLWSYPQQDNPSIQLADTISTRYGFRNKVVLNHRSVSLPERGEDYYVLQVGQYYPSLMNWYDQPMDQWIRLDHIAIRTKMVVNVYVVDGIVLPLSDCYYRYTDNKNLVLAIRRNNNIPVDYQSEKFYLRVYSNHMFRIKLPYKVLPEDYIDILSIKISSNEDVSEVLSFIQKHTNIGHGFKLFLYVNGIKRDTISPQDLTPNNNIDIIYDSTIYKKVSIKLTSLHTFDSILDEKRKYLVTYPSATGRDIDYHDDQEFYLVRKPNHRNKDTSNRGVYYHRNNKDAVRQLTPSDYSIVIPYVDGLLKASNQEHNLDKRKIFDKDLDVYLELYLRKSTVERPYTYNNHKLHDLYRLPYEERVKVMVGMHSNIPEWRADVLEKSLYIEVMSSLLPTYDTDKVAKALGYHAISRLTGDSPSDPSRMIYESGHDFPIINLPPTLTIISSHWEYDDQGLLLGVYSMKSKCSYAVKNKDAKLVEHIYGFATDDIGKAYNQKTYTVRPDDEYRIYRVPKGRESYPKEWVDVTDNNDNLFIATEDSRGNRIVTWLEEQTGYTTLLRTDRHVLSYSVYKKLDNGIIDLFLTEVVTMDDGNKVRWKMMVPRGHLDIYLNGHALVRNIDYFVDFPRVVIVCKNYFYGLENGERQHITVRFHGFCTEDLEMLNPEQTGYVKDNRLSMNKRYNAREDKVLNYIVGGGVYSPDVLGFAEDNSSINIPKRSDTGVIEGQPYQIKDIIVPIKKLIKEDTYQLRDKSIELEERISNYVSMHTNEPKLDRIIPVKKLYPLYSPFLSWILDDIVRDTHGFSKFYEHYSDQDVKEFCLKYEYLLNFDPVYQNKAIDKEYVIIHPHPLYHVVDLNIYQYKLFERINRLYMGNEVKTSHFVRKVNLFKDEELI